VSQAAFSMAEYVWTCFSRFGAGFSLGSVQKVLKKENQPPCCLFSMKVFEYWLDSKGFALSEVHAACLILIHQTQHGFRRILVQSAEELAAQLVRVGLERRGKLPHAGARRDALLSTEVTKGFTGVYFGVCHGQRPTDAALHEPIPLSSLETDLSRHQ